MSLNLIGDISRVPFFLPVESCRYFQMETPFILENNGKFCWELVVELEFPLEEHRVFIVEWKMMLGS